METRFSFSTRSYNNRSGFVHIAELYDQGKHIATGKSQYYNRTWEAYRFQTVMQIAVDNAELVRESELYDQIKAEFNAKSKTKAVKAEFKIRAANDQYLNELKALNDSL